MEKVVAHGIDIARFFAGDTEDQRDVVGGEGPEDVLFPADLAQGEAAGVDVLEAADLPGADHLLEADDGGVIVQDVADEEDPAALRGEADQGFAVGVREGEGLFHEDVLARLKGRGGDGVVEGGRGGDDDGGDLRIVQDGGHVRGDGDVRIGLGHLCTDRLGAVADGPQDAQLVEIADQVLAPVARANDGDGGAGGQGGDGGQVFKISVFRHGYGV